MNPRKTISRTLLLSLALGLTVLLTSCFPQQQPPPPAASPVAQFSYVPTVPKVGEEVLFDGSASSAPAGATLVAYRWDFGDGASGEGVSVTHTYAQAGSYTVQLTVTDDQSRQATATQTISVVAPPSAEALKLPQGIMDLQGLAWDGENFWALDSANVKLYKLSGTTGQALATFELADAEYPTAVAWDGESRRLFVLDGNSNTIYQINPDDGSVVRSLELAGGVPLGMTWGDGSLWVSDFDAVQVYRVSPEDGRVLQTIIVGVPGAALLSLSWGAGALWVYDGNSDMIYKLDPASGQKLGELVPPGPGTVGLAWDGQSLWVADGSELKLYKVRP